MTRRERLVNPDKRIIDLLAPDQLRMVRMTFTGVSDAQIAYLMGKAEQTVKNSFTRAFSATGARNRTHLAALVWWEIEGRIDRHDNPDY